MLLNHFKYKLLSADRLAVVLAARGSACVVHPARQHFCAARQRKPLIDLAGIGKASLFQHPARGWVVDEVRRFQLAERARFLGEGAHGFAGITPAPDGPAEPIADLE